MKIIDYTQLFVNIDDEIKLISSQDLKKYLNLKKFRLNQMKMSVSEYMTLILMYRLSSHRLLKGFWYDLQTHYKKDFPCMPSYNVFITWINRLEKILTQLLNKRLHTLSQELGMVDSTKLEVCKPYRNGKVHRAASKGYSSLGAFRGFKLHILINDKNQLCSYKITTGKVHDLNVVKEGLFDGHTGKILADSGYISKQMYWLLMEKNIQFIAKPKANMMLDNSFGLGYLPNWEDNFKKIYKKRMKIERLFDYFKDKLGLVLHKLHSTKALMTHVISVLLINQMLANQEIFFKII